MAQLLFELKKFDVKLQIIKIDIFIIQYLGGKNHFCRSIAFQNE
jgi:hypothetical protein